MKLSSIMLGTCLLTLAACGGSGGSGSNSNKTETTRILQRQEDIGLYQAILAPLNSSVAGETVGNVQVEVVGDDFAVEVRVKGAPAGVKHIQSIMTGTSCPDLSQDVNGDGLIDIMEGMKSFGKVLIPLDSNLSEQIAGSDFGPIANSAGAYVYRRSTSLTTLLADLRAADPDTQDHIVKLPFGSDLNLSGRIVVVHGVSTDSALTDSVATIGDMSPAQSLPIACGKLVRIEAQN